MTKRIVTFKGGLGNQMFQYSLFRVFNELGFETYADLSWFDQYKSHNGYELPKVFDIGKIDSSRYESINPLFKFSKIWRFLNDKLIEDEHHIVDDFDFDKNRMMFSSRRDIGCDGYWQSERYFLDYQDLIRSTFVFKGISKKNIDLVESLTGKETVSVHVRRGDYLNIPLHQDCCPASYYDRAIGSMRNGSDGVTFLVFSDDIPWCRKELDTGKDETIYVDWNSGPDSYQDMYLMSRCRHNIIANSSFSWWGAWLNSDPRKKVFAPVRWFNSDSIPAKDVVPPAWTKI